MHRGGYAAASGGLALASTLLTAPVATAAAAASPSSGAQVVPARQQAISASVHNPGVAPRPRPRGSARTAASVDCNPPRGHRGAVGESWAQKRLGFERVWPLTMGQGVTVAVIDSGAETDHPMLSGRVSKVIDLTGTGARDCVGHGTGVAALVGGRSMSAARVPLSGVAPEAELLIIKQQNADTDDEGGDRLPGAIRKAVSARAKVINISIRARHSPALEAAVRDALRRNVVIVAASGNVRKLSGDEGPAYPAGYTGVISVASLGADGTRAESSSVQARVDLAAPGKDVHTAWTLGGYHLQAQGTSFAAAYVSGVAALVRSRHPSLGARQVAHRIVATADGNAGEGTGNGMVNPVQAVTAVLPEEGGAARPDRPAAAARFAAPVRTDARTRDVAIAVAGGALGTAGLAALGGIVLPMGRRRGWRPGRAALPARSRADENDATGPQSGTIGAGR